jgi:hypothetical protein
MFFLWFSFGNIQLFAIVCPAFNRTLLCNTARLAVHAAGWVRGLKSFWWLKPCASAGFFVFGASTRDLNGQQRIHRTPEVCK